MAKTQGQLLKEQGYLGPVETANLMYKLVSDVKHSPRLETLSLAEKEIEAYRVYHYELKCLRKSSIPKQVIGSGKGTKYYYKAEEVKAYIQDRIKSVRESYGIKE